MKRCLLLGPVLMIALVACGDTLAAQSAAACAPPAEWGATKTFGKWSVRRVCTLGSDILSVGAASDAGMDRAFVFLCDNEDGPRGMFSLNKMNFEGPLSLTLKGSQLPAVDIEGLNMAGQATLVNIEDSPAFKRFEAAIIDGSAPTFTLVLTPPGKAPLEMTFAREGLAAAVKPLRIRCRW
jgi:hypothetical protein